MIFIRFQILAVFIALCSAQGKDIPDDTEIGRRLYAGDLSVIDELAEIGTPEAIDAIHMMVVQFQRGEDARKCPDVRPRALEALRSIDGAANELARRIQELGSSSGVQYRGILMATLTEMRNEEAVRAVGELLFDDAVDMSEPWSPDVGPPGANNGFAASTFAFWLIDEPEVPRKYKEMSMPGGVEAWAEWWRERRHDPEVVRAIAEGLPLPPPTTRNPESPKPAPIELLPAVGDESMSSPSIALPPVAAGSSSCRQALVVIGGVVAVGVLALLLVLATKRSH